MPRKIDGPHPTDVHVGRRLCEARVAAGLNQTDLGRALGITFQQVQKYEKGANRVSASKLADAARFLKLPIAWFFDGLGLPGEADTSFAGLEAISPQHRRLLDGFDQLSAPNRAAIVRVVEAAAGTVTEEKIAA